MNVDISIINPHPAPNPALLAEQLHGYVINCLGDVQT
jgi:hypothetical protein